ncbi:MAG TPA: alpha/beta fold hydrolase [Opitutaceae bacterium]|nr:alpha/beta fold hydrolase [Opitutaceae bacterium]
MKLAAVFACSLGMLASPRAVAADPVSPPRETVVLLHGLGRTRWSMSRLASELARDGYRVVNLTYPSRSLPLETLAHEWLPRELRAAQVDDAPRVHLVTHSMGGILVRLWLRDAAPPPNLGRVVMLAPPNAGSEVADRLNAFPPFRWFTGANGRRLGTAPDALPRALGPWTTPAPLGVIAGDRALNPLFIPWLPGANDGKVTVASTHLAGEADHLVVHHSHTWLGWHRDTIAQVKAFLRTGIFFRPGANEKITVPAARPAATGPARSRA